MPGRGLGAQMYKDIDVLKTPHNLKKWSKTLSSLFYLVNLYSFPNSSLGLHQDKVEKDLNNPVL